MEFFSLAVIFNYALLGGVVTTADEEPVLVPFLPSLRCPAPPRPSVFGSHHCTLLGFSDATCGPGAVYCHAHR